MSNNLFSSDAELALINLVFRNKDMFFTLSAVKSYMFSSSPNQLLFSTLADLILDGLVPDTELVSVHLESKNLLASVGGNGYIQHIYSLEYNENNLMEYERVVVSSYKARKIISLSSGVNEEIRITEDVDSVIYKYKRELDSLEADSIHGARDLTSILKQSWDELCDRVENPGVQGISTGLAGLDIATNGMAGNQLWIVSGRPGMGKSSVMASLAYNQAKLGVPSILFSLEMSETSIIERVLASVTGISLTSMKLGTLSQIEMNKISDAIKTIKEYPFFIDAKYDPSMTAIISSIRRFAKTRGLKTVYIDYLQLLARRDSNATQEIGQICRDLKLLARELDITIVLGSQLNRGVEMRDNKRPVLHDLRQSGNIEEDADIVIGIYRDELYDANTKDKGIMETIILKNRSGPTGTVELKFMADICRVFGDKHK